MATAAHQAQWMKEYTGQRIREISFPIGGIGTGCIGLRGDGRLREWEIRNHPDKGALNGFSHIAVKAEHNGQVLDARVLNTDLADGLTGQYVDRMWFGFGHGPFRETMAGIPHFADGVFQAQYPFARLRFKDKDFPGQVALKAFNPFIPLNADDSSIPAGFFEVELRNDTALALDYTVAFSLGSMFSQAEGQNTYEHTGGSHCLRLRNARAPKDDLTYGELCVGTDAADVSYQQYWFRGQWYDGLSVFWQSFTAPQRLANRVYDGPTPAVNASVNDTATLAAHVTLAPGESRSVRFVVSWYFPNCNYYLDPARQAPDGATQWKNYYATRWPDAPAVCFDALRRWDHLEAETRKFTDAFYTQTLPEDVFDAISANISILKSPTVLRLENGEFWAWEGVHCRAGSCEGSCTHVWNYAYALPFLFPSLERSMRELDYRYNQDEHGGMQFRLQLPLGSPRSAFRPCCDGQFGGVVKTYREWKICGDDKWLRALWPAVKKSLAFAWSPDNLDRWDADRDGVLEGRQHHTLDMELFGPNSWLTSMYLAALKAAAEMAQHLGEPDAAADYLRLYENGRAYVDDKLFNGEYYQQHIDLSDPSILLPFDKGVKSLQGDSVMDAYWNKENGELKYQFGEGCAIDQQLGQWHASLCGLGDILDPGHSRLALEAVYRHNYKRSLRRHFNPCRIYATGDEQTTIICDWPEGKRRPVISAPYSEEGWPGCEYQAASQMLLSDMYEEGLELVSAVRGRFDGAKRNPWNEFECGSNYSRSMSSYALLLALSGFRFDMSTGAMGFVPHDPSERRRYFWSLDSDYGLFTQQDARRSLQVISGRLTLRQLETDRPAHTVSLNGQPVAFRQDGNTAVFSEAVTLLPGSELCLA